jgi:hypothetical protein
MRTPVFLTANEFNIGILDQSIESILQDGRRPDSHVRWLPRNRWTRYAADPFGVMRNGILYIFYELLEYGRSVPVIVFVEVTPGGKVSSPKPVLRADCHISYPYLLEHGGDLFLVPETAQAREVALFKCRQFPDVWTKVSVLIRDLSAADSTLLHHEGCWWLFCTAYRHMSELHIWYARDLLGPWQPHPRNPVKVDVHSARPGGTPFVSNGQLYRPAIDTAPHFGCRVVINRVDELSVDCFSEEPVTTVEPELGGAFPDGLHTLSGVGSTTLIDGWRCVSALDPARLAGRSWAMATRALQRRSADPPRGAMPAT